jgi:hypothetical protein
MRLDARLAFPLAVVAVGVLATAYWRGATPSVDRPLRAIPVSDPSEDARSEAVIPSQCYARTDGGRNPCFTCHTRGRTPNPIDDSSRQTRYPVSVTARRNAWSNSFVARSELVRRSNEKETLDWVRYDNHPQLLMTLERPPNAWDEDDDGRFDGYVPDIAFRFDHEGFDRAVDRTPTGWRIFAHYPFPGAFWPTNSGAWSEVAIRLPEALRQRSDGSVDEEVYRVNLAVAEGLMNERDVPIPSVDERKYDVDLNQDGRLGMTTLVRASSWIGKGRQLPAQNGLLPEGTELLQTLRYLDVSAGRVGSGARIRELRYAKKTRSGEHAGTFVTNSSGWLYRAFIEDDMGELRPETRTELATCVGCHGAIGATTDSGFSFSRKLPPTAHAGGWYRSSELGWEGIAQPRRKDGRGEYTTYLEAAGAGDDFGSNVEAKQRFFRVDGSLDTSAVARLDEDVSVLLLPSPTRALRLTQAYWGVVAEQSYEKGREPVFEPVQNVFQLVPENQPTAVREPIAANWMPVAQR